MKTIYAPKWAIDLVERVNRMDIVAARVLAIDTLFDQDDCSYEIARDMVYEDCNFKSGKLYPVKDVDKESFYCLDENGKYRFCLIERCAHIDFGNWTLVNMESE